MILALVTFAAGVVQPVPTSPPKAEGVAKARVVIRRAARVDERQWNQTARSQRREVVFTDQSGQRHVLRLIEFE